MGRYGSSGLPDVTVNADGTLALLTNGQGLASIEAHTDKFDVYLYAGAEFVGRHIRFNSEKAKVGCGLTTADNSGCFIEPPSRHPCRGTVPGIFHRISAGCARELRHHTKCDRERSHADPKIWSAAGELSWKAGAPAARMPKAQDQNAIATEAP